MTHSIIFLLNLSIKNSVVEGDIPFFVIFTKFRHRKCVEESPLPHIPPVLSLTTFHFRVEFPFHSLCVFILEPTFFKRKKTTKKRRKRTPPREMKHIFCTFSLCCNFIHFRSFCGFGFNIKIKMSLRARECTKSLKGYISTVVKSYALM